MESGGSERQMLQLLQGLDRNLIRPHLYLTYASGPLLDQVPSDVKVDSYAKSYSRAYAVVPGSLYALQLKKLRSSLRARKIDVTYDRLYHTVMLTAAACKGLAVQRVVTVVSPPSRDFGQSRQRWMSIKRALLGWSYRSATSLLAVSQESAEDASTFYSISPDRWAIVPSPIDYDKIQVQASLEPPPDFNPTHKLDMVAVGRLSKEKNHALLLECLSILIGKYKVEPHLHIVGDGVLRGELEQLVKNKRLEQNVTFYGVQPNPAAIVSRCDVLCLPSFYEGFPNVVMEAMACRTPVIASQNAGGLRELLGANQERGLRLSPEDADAWAAAIASLPKKVAMEEQIAAADKWVRERHSLPVWIGQMQHIFQSTKRP